MFQIIRTKNPIDHSPTVSCKKNNFTTSRLAFTNYGGLGPSCSSHYTQISQAPNNNSVGPAANNSATTATKTSAGHQTANGSGYFVGMAMGMSMASDAQHHSMSGMNGLSYSHGKINFKKLIG